MRLRAHTCVASLPSTIISKHSCAGPSVSRPLSKSIRAISPEHSNAICSPWALVKLRAFRSLATNAKAQSQRSGTRRARKTEGSAQADHTGMTRVQSSCGSSAKVQPPLGRPVPQALRTIFNPPSAVLFCKLGTISRVAAKHLPSKTTTSAMAKCVKMASERVLIHCASPGPVASKQDGRSGKDQSDLPRCGWRRSHCRRDQLLACYIAHDRATGALAFKQVKGNKELHGGHRMISGVPSSDRLDVSSPVFLGGNFRLVRLSCPAGQFAVAASPQFTATAIENMSEL